MVHLLGGLYGDVPSDVINVYQPPGTDICITFKSSLMRGCFRWYQSHRLAVGCDPRSETPFSSLSTLGPSIPFVPKYLCKACSPYLCFQMAKEGWTRAIAK